MAELTAGMRNNNPGNIKYVGQPGTTPSVNTDQGDPQAVYASPQAGMNAMYRLLRLKYSGGRRTVRQIIADNGGWTPGNIQAAENIARSAGIGIDDDIGLDDPGKAQRFMRGLLLQEHGDASNQYDDGMLASAITGGGSGAPQGGGGGQFAYRLEGGAARPDAVTGMDPAFRTALMSLYANAPPEVQKELGLTSAFRSHQRQQELWDASDKSGKMVAKPGTSKHESGTAADLLGFGLKGGGNAVSQATRDWVKANAGKYNLAFPMDYEPWHVQLASSPSGATGTATAAAPGAAAAKTDDAGRADLTKLLAGKGDDKKHNWMTALGEGLSGMKGASGVKFAGAPSGRPCRRWPPRIRTSVSTWRR
jgi:hypothetical protein